MNNTHDGGCRAFFATFRPRNGITDDTIRRIVKYAPQLCKYWYIVEEKTGTERHVHACLFPHKRVQRSNIITMLIRNCIDDWDDDEKRNFRRWDKCSSNGAVKHMTNMEVLTAYLSGAYATKAADHFATIDTRVPDDLSELETWLPQVGELAKPKNMKFVHLLRQLSEHLDWPSREEAGDKKFWNVGYTWHCLCWLEVNDIRETMIDVRLKRQFAYAFHCWFLRQPANVNFSWTTTTEYHPGVVDFSPQAVIDSLLPRQLANYQMPVKIPKSVDPHNFANVVGA